MSDQETKSILSEIIQSKDFSRFIGLKENLWFEAKGKDPYNLDSPIDRYELAKDVSAFANTQGGYIIIGLKQERIEEEMTEKIIDLDLIEEKNFLIDRYVGIINEYIYPLIKGLEIKWAESNKNPGFGIGYILVPSQDENKKYFLVKNVFEENQMMSRIVFGLVQRIDSSNTSLTIGQLHQKLQQGKSPMAERITRIENKIDVMKESLFRPSVSSPASPESIEKKIEERIKKMKLFSE